jgi:hypothetical protein
MLSLGESKPAAKDASRDAESTSRSPLRDACKCPHKCDFPDIDTSPGSHCTIFPSARDFGTSIVL